MERSVAMLAIGLILGGGIGFVVAAANGITLDGHDHGSHDMHGGEIGQSADHDHDELLSLPADSNAPKLDIAVAKDPVSGWNLHVMTANFRFAPDHASQPHIDGEGHAHVYVNGVKIARAYGPWMHIASLPAGTAEIKVVLTSNDHKPLAIGGTPVSASLIVSVD